MTKIENWDGVDNTLKRLAELEVGIAKVNGDSTIKINEIKNTDFEQEDRKVEILNGIENFPSLVHVCIYLKLISES